MSKPSGRPKSDDPKAPLTVRVPKSIMAQWSDQAAARAAIEALVQAHYGPGLRAELVKAIAGAPVGLNKVAPASLQAVVKPAPAEKPFKSRLKGEWKAP